MCEFVATYQNELFVYSKHMKLLIEHGHSLPMGPLAFNERGPPFYSYPYPFDHKITS